MFNALPTLDLPFLPLIDDRDTINDPQAGAQGQTRRARLINVRANECLDCSGVMIIGRSERCEVRIEEAFASRLHAAIVSTCIGFYLFDLHSKNGTHVNGNKVEHSVALESGDQIMIGGSLILFSLEP